MEIADLLVLGLEINGPNAVCLDIDKTWLQLVHFSQDAMKAIVQKFTKKDISGV